MPKKEKITVLVTGVGAMGVGEGIIKCLKSKKNKYEIIATNIDHNAPLMFRADTGYIVPPASDPEYIKRLLEICKKEDVQVLIPGSEAELKIISRNRELFGKERILLLINTQNAIDIGFDKWKTYEFLSKNNFITPKSTLSLNDFEFFQTTNFPIVVKPREGHGSKYFYIAEDEKEIRFFSEYLTRRKIPYVFQEYVGSPDNEYTIGILSDKKGNIIKSIAMKRLLQGGFSQHVSVDKFEKISKICEDITRKIRSVGPLNVQGRMTEKGFCVFEINPRFSGSAPFRAIIGLNEPDSLIDTFLFNKKRGSFQIKKGVVGMRFLHEIYIDEQILDKKKVSPCGSLGDYL